MPPFRRFALSALALAAGLLPASAPRADLVLPRPSPNASVSQTIGNTVFTLTYSRPGVKGRTIWGGLVPYDTVWRTGANDPTTLVTTDDIKIGGAELPAGTYRILTLPTAKEWTVIFSKQEGLMGSTNYDSKFDALRLTGTPTLDQPHQEWMWLGFDDLSPTGANLVLRWEKLRLAVPLEVNVNELVLADCRSEIAAAKADDWRTAFNAARWCFDNTVALEEGFGWLDKSIGVQKTHANLNLKARWLQKDGKVKEAVVVAKEAVAVGKASKDPVDTSATEKLIADWTAKKK